MSTSIVKIYNGRMRRPEKNARVVLGFNLGMTKPVYTDSNGNATISHSMTGMATIFINGKSFHKIRAPGSESVTI